MPALRRSGGRTAVYWRVKAIVINQHGGPEGIDYQEVGAPPSPAAGQVRIRVHAAGLNRADILQRRGKYPAPPGYPPNIPGLEFAGEIEELGEGVTNWKKGDRVFGITAGGAQAEKVIVAANNIARVPANLDWTHAGAVPEVFITAHDALFTRGHLQRGEQALVHAAASGVGTAAVQLAHAAGATVYGTSRSANKLERLREEKLGLEHGVAGDSAKIVAAVKKWTDDRGVDVILDLVGADYFAANLEMLAVLGRLICVGTTGGAQADAFPIAQVMRKRASIIGTVLRARSIAEKGAAVERFAAEVLPLLEKGTVRPVLECIYRPEEIRRAHEHLESNKTFGKIVLTFS